MKHPSSYCLSLKLADKKKDMSWSFVCVWFFLALFTSPCKRKLLSWLTSVRKVDPMVKGFSYCHNLFDYWNNLPSFWNDIFLRKLPPKLFFLNLHRKQWYWRIYSYKLTLHIRSYPLGTLFLAILGLTLWG